MGGFEGYYLCSGAPVISHLHFANDTINFCKVNLDQTQMIKDIQMKYETTSGQIVNFLKTDVTLSKDVLVERKP